MCNLLQEFADCFAWNYTDIPGLSWDLVEHVLSIKRGLIPYKQPPRNYSPELMQRIKEEVEHLLEAKFIRACRYADWVSNILHIEKKNTSKIRICVDFRNLN
jgi:hypothetical protein